MQHKTILLVEDNESDVELTKRAFKKAHIANPLVVARNGREACDYVFGSGFYADRAAADLPALVLLDLKLPLISGMEVLRRIRSDPRTHALIVIILTSSDALPDITAAYELGANSFLRKPVNFDQFNQLVEQIAGYWLVVNIGPAPA
jgi:two-component system response regulator